MEGLLLTTFVEWLKDVDTDVLMFINSHHNAFFDVVMKLYSNRDVWMPFYLALFLLVVNNFKWKTSLMIVVGVALVITLCDQLSSSLLRPIFARLRPCDVENPLSQVVHLVNGYKAISYGFPSAHGANTVGLACFMALVIRRKWFTVLMVVWALVMCYSRPYLGVHYPGDLLAGAVIGSVIAMAVYALYRLLPHKEEPQHYRFFFIPHLAWAATVAVLAVIAIVRLLS